MKSVKLLVLIFILVALAAAGVFLYFSKQFRPIAIVGTELINEKNWEDFQKVAKNFSSNQKTQALFGNFISQKENEALAKKLKVDSLVNENGEFKYYTFGKDQEYKDLLSKYFESNEALFKETIVKPLAFEAQLRIKFNSYFSANQDAYSKAQIILAKLNEGSKFEDLAKTESDDKSSSQLGGDLGFVATEQIMPELASAMLASQLGEIRKQIVITRLGYEIIYPVETSEKDVLKVYHLKHILIETEGFEAWRDSEAKNIFVWRIINPK